MTIDNEPTKPEANSTMLLQECVEVADLSDEARALLEECKPLADTSHQAGVWSSSTPEGCPNVATCGMLVIVDRKGSASLSAEIRKCYDNGSCLQTCSLNVLNPGYLPKQVCETGSYNSPRYLG